MGEAMIAESLKIFLERATGLRAYPLAAPQGLSRDDDFIVYHRISATRDHHQGGASGLTQCRYQVDFWGEDYGRLQGHSDKLRKLLDAQRHFNLGDTERVTDCRVAVLEEEADEFAFTGDGSDRPLRRVRQDWILWVREELAVAA